jgi:hypothetical protein
MSLLCRIERGVRIEWACLGIAVVNKNCIVGIEILTAVVMKSTIFWDITPCSPLEVNRRFGGTYRFHLQGRRISGARNQPESRWQAELVPCSAYSSTLKM